MREIEFRAKGIDNNQWFNGSYVEQYYSTSHGCCIDAIFYTEDVPPHPHTHRIPIDIQTLGQFIGYRDRENTKIYEGDIVKMDSWKGIHKIAFIEGAFCLAFENGDFAADIYYIQTEYEHCVVIGNIYDNKMSELLKEYE